MSRVPDLDDVVATLQRQGASVQTPGDLKPEHLGRNGYVGCPVAYQGKYKVIWVLGFAVIKTENSQARATVAQWLTETVANSGGEVTVVKLISDFLRRFRVNRSDVTPIEQVSLLSHVAWEMGFIQDPYDTTLKLPDDHPLKR